MRRMILLTFLMVVASALRLVAAGERVSYNFEVRPILAGKCFSCHGSDPKNRKGDLRLDDAAAAVEAGAIVKGQPDASELIKRIHSADKEEVMPPPERQDALSDKEKAVLRRWIEQGAEYDRHWAFVPPDAGLISQNIDAIVESAWQANANGLKPAQAADKSEWLRRVTLALTGLPPSLEERTAFLADATDATKMAREQVVDRLLASPRYGERMAAVWLDVARYADTYGRHEDGDNAMWPWREWVIRAMNQNMPYDQFVTWQLAGDLLPNATQEQRLATGFGRLAVMTNEAGSDPEENRWMQVFDRVETTATAFLGLTMGCAQCHDHKYDPITMRDYYQMASYFDKADEFGLFARYCNGTPPPSAFVYRNGQAKEHERLKEAIVGAERRWQGAREAARANFAVWLKANAPPLRGEGLWESLAVVHEVRPAALMTQPEVYAGFDAMNTKQGRFMIANNPDLLIDGAASRKRWVDGVIGRACEFPDLKATRYKFPAQLGYYRRYQPFTFSIWLKAEVQPERGVILHRCRAGQDATHRGYELMFLDGKLTASLCHFYPGNAIRIQAREKLSFANWRHIALTYDGSSRAGGLKIYVDGSAIPCEIVRDHLYRDIDYRPEWKDIDGRQVADGADRVAMLTIGGRTLDTGLTKAAVDEFRAYNVELSPVEVQFLAGGAQAGTGTDGEWFDWYCREVDRNSREALTALRAARQAENDFNIGLQEIMVMGDAPTLGRKTPILSRGDFRHPGETVDPAPPSVLLPAPKDAPKNRLGLAQWLVDAQNPLTSRVQVNRLWMLFFGDGLVATPQDFGIQGQVPAIPQLLDYLALRLVHLKWDMKALCREIALSAVYSRSSVPEDAALTRQDPENRFLARGPRFRLTAEQLRDSALAASGLLSPTLGGPSVMPYQPPGLWEDSGTQHTYVQDKGESLYRRSIYTFWRRTCPPPTMMVFDAPTREFCLAQRDTTSTPLQVLALLNDTGFLEAARVLAEKLVEEHPAGKAPDADAQRTAKAFQLLTGRDPLPRQGAALAELIAESRANFGKDSQAVADAEKLLTAAGEHPRRPGLPPAEVAATLVMIRAIYNAEPFLSSY